MSMEKKVCLIPDVGEYRLKRSKILDQNCESTGNDFGNVSRAKRGIPASMGWRICEAK